MDETNFYITQVVIIIWVRWGPFQNDPGYFTGFLIEFDFRLILFDFRLPEQS